MYETDLPPLLIPLAMLVWPAPQVRFQPRPRFVVPPSAVSQRTRNSIGPPRPRFVAPPNAESQRTRNSRHLGWCVYDSGRTHDQLWTNESSPVPQASGCPACRSNGWKHSVIFFRNLGLRDFGTSGLRACRSNGWKHSVIFFRNLGRDFAGTWDGTSGTWDGTSRTTSSGQTSSRQSLGHPAAPLANRTAGTPPPACSGTWDGTSHPPARPGAG